MEHPLYKFYITEEDGRFLHVQNGVVTSSSTPRALPNSPDGWQSMVLAWERDIKLLGINRTLSLPFVFYKDGAHILRKMQFSESIERKLYLVIARLYREVSGGVAKPVYRKLYKGEIDPTSFKNGAYGIEASISEGGLTKLFNANRGTMYEFPLSEGDALVKMDGINLAQTHNYIITPQQLKNYHFIPVSHTISEGEAAGTAALDQLGQEVPFNYDYGSGVNNFLTTTQTIPNIRLKGRVSFAIPISSTAFFEASVIRISLYRTSTGTATHLVTVNNPVNAQQYTFDIDHTFTSVPGERFYLTGTVEKKSGVGNAGIYYSETSLSVSVVSRYRETYVQAYTPYRLYQRLIKAITGSEDYAFSTLLQQYSHHKLTSGDGLRGIDGAKIKTSLDQFFDYCYTQMFAGIGVEDGKVLIEDRGHFLNPTDPVDLGEPKDLQILEDKEQLFNTVRFGYQPTQIDDVNGKYSFNNSLTFGTHVTRVVKEFTLICPYAADPFAIELIRINLEGRTTTDDKTDNQIFILDAPNKDVTLNIQAEAPNTLTFYNTTDTIPFPVGKKFTIRNAGMLDGTYTVAASFPNGTNLQVQVVENVTAGSYVSAVVTVALSELYRSSSMVITGVPDPATIFNVRLSPKRMLLRWMPWINSILYKEAGQKLTFLTADKNDSLSTTENGVTITEKANVTIGTERLFLAKILLFENRVPKNLSQIKEETPNRAFSTTWEGVTLTGFDLKLGMAPTDQKEQSFRLLSTTTNDFKSFIHG